MIPLELEELLAPLERFESIRRRAVRLGDRLADLSYANPYGGIQQDAKAAIRAALDDDRILGLQYSPFGGYVFIRRAIADALRVSHGLDFTFEDVVLGAGAMAALNLALRVSGRHGGEVVVPVPCWIDHPLYVRATGLTWIPVPLMPHSFDLDVIAIEQALSERTAAVLFSTPANPTGRSYPPESLAALGQAIRRAEERYGSQISVIADEAHRDFMQPGRFHSASAFVDRTLLIYSFGKYHFMQGQRLGYVAVSPRHPDRRQVSEELVRWARILGLATPTSVMQRAVPGLLALEHDQRWLVDWRERVVDELIGVGYSVVRPDATMFIYVQTPDRYDDFAFIEKLAAAGVLALPAPIFHHHGSFRLSLTGTEGMLTRALDVMARTWPG
jgi:aspartate/methionine/tyrosine aminotransferase